MPIPFILQVWTLHGDDVNWSWKLPWITVVNKGKRSSFFYHINYRNYSKHSLQWHPWRMCLWGCSDNFVNIYFSHLQLQYFFKVIIIIRIYVWDNEVLYDNWHTKELLYFMKSWCHITLTNCGARSTYFVIITKLCLQESLLAGKRAFTNETGKVS